MLDSLLMLWYYVFVRKVLKIWNDTFDQMLSLPPPEAQRKLTLIAWQATLYWLWNERNGRLHSNIFRSTHQIFRLLDAQLRNKLQSFRNTNPARSSTMMQSWFRFAWILFTITGFTQLTLDTLDTSMISKTRVNWKDQLGFYPGLYLTLSWALRGLFMWFY